VTARKQGTGRRLVDHDCGSWDCLQVLSLGPARPRPAVGELVLVDWSQLTPAEQFAHFYGSPEAAEAAWRFHRGQLASLDRIQLAMGEPPTRPAALQVFEEPDVTWPPPVRGE
jgi:hypothetical protein